MTKRGGDRYEGTFVNGKFDGEMSVYYSDGRKFRGMYKNGMRNGKAIEMSKEGRRREVMYVDDEEVQ